MMQNFKEIYETSVHSMLYILNRAKTELDFHKIFKIMYFAEQKHLAKYGRMITKDSYIRMPKGPVPSYAYNVFQIIRSNNRIFEFNDYFKIKGKFKVEALVNYDSDELSETDIECLNESFNENINLNFDELTEKSHGLAWKNALYSDAINVYQMAKEAGASDEMVKYIKHMNMLKKTCA
jgi:uncharacterized phage-associated protein